MSSVRPQNVENANSTRQEKQPSRKNDELKEDGPKLGIVESYSIMQAAVSIIILSIITHLWAKEGHSPSAFVVLFSFQLFILAVALILLATGNDAWFSFVFAQLVLFMGIAELTTSAFVVLRDMKFEQCREYGCTIVRGSTILRTRFAYASALCGLFHIATGIVYLIVGPHCHDTPEPKITISKGLFARLKIRLINTDRSGSTVHTIARQLELNDVRISGRTTHYPTPAVHSAQIMRSEKGASVGSSYALRKLERAKDAETPGNSNIASRAHPIRTTVVEMDTSVPLTVRYVDSSLDESVGNDTVIAANKSINAMVSFDDLLLSSDRLSGNDTRIDR
uniref:MARVEL domain-containing protein n=1 Tax=Ascaris lumbricoides TaxID=6252 RepID=A0A0M3ID69_ASCLU